MTAPAIRVENLWKNFRLYHEKNQYIKAAVLRGRRARYEEFWALKGVSLEIPHGSTFGIIGPNGCGKSTLLKCLAGILFPDKGSVSVDGRISALLELGAGFHPELSGVENIYLNGAILGMTRKDIEARFDSIVDFSGLSTFIDTPVRNYSSGMVIRLGFAIAANVDPEILLVDEVLSVGDQSFQQRCLEKIEDFRNDGRTIVFVSHGLAQVTQLCEQAAWIESGEIRRLGPAAQLVSEYTGASQESMTRDEGEIGERWGSGEGRIVSIELLDEHGAKLKTPATGKPLTIRISYEAHLPLKRPVIGLRINHLHGAIVWGATTRKRGVVVEQIVGPGHVDLVIPNLPLLEGTYDISVALSNFSEVHIYDHWEKKVRFDVAQHGVFDQGFVTVDSHWEWPR
jgi:ABC-type polysaccharide/polyol phosphate transport system ATPase subunit